MRGVELFSLGLIRDLDRRGVKITVPAHPSWKKDFEVIFPGRALMRETPWRNSFLNGLQAAWRARRGESRKIIVGNVANGLIPALLFMRIFKGPLQPVVFAHRMPTARFMAVLPSKDTRVLAVNGIIAASFRAAGFAAADVFFGHIDAGKYHPADDTPRVMDKGKKVNFCVIGFLDNAWKGADTALAAFRALPADVSARCVLHLASFRSPPAFPESNIKTYPWFPADGMGEFLRGMDVMIVPSRDEKVMRETFSLAMIEGMLTGLPVLASNLPVLAEKLDSGGGYTFNNVEELSRLMALLVSDLEKRTGLGKNARRTALERYVWNTEKFISRYLG